MSRLENTRRHRLRYLQKVNSGVQKSAATASFNEIRFVSNRVFYYRRLALTIFFSAALYACSGDDTVVDPEPIQAGTTSQAVNSLEDIDGLWNLNLPISIANVTIEINPDGQGGSSGTASTFSTTRNWFRIRADGKIDLVVENTSSLDDDDDNCIFVEENFESWTPLGENRYLAMSGTGSQEIRIRQNEAGLILQQNEASVTYRRASEDALANLDDCEDSLTGLRAEGYDANEITSLSEIEGLWRVPQSISSISISESTFDNSSENFIQINQDGSTSMWRFNAERECLSRTRNTSDIDFEQRNSAFVKLVEGQVFNTFRLFETQLSVIFGNTTPRFLLFTSLDSEMPSAFYARSSLGLAMRENRCEVIPEDLTNAQAVTSLSSVAGVWQLPGQTPTDKRFLSLDSAGTLIRYDFRGDVDGGGDDCYLETGRSRLENIAENHYREVINENFSEEIDIFLSSLEELILLSENNTTLEYNNELKRDEELSVSMLSPLCPRVLD